jgi:Leucine-rich repeat (LRR) protein
MNYQGPYNTTDPCAWNPQVVQCTPTGSIIGLNFSNMGLSGPIPPEIGLFPSLETLDFSNYPTNSPSCTGPCNSVLGPIPKELGNLTNLQILLLTRSSLSEPFPPPVLNLVNLIELKIDNCNLLGPIPLEISNLSKLQILFLGNNSLVGPLPGLGSLINLQELTLWGNGISDKIPPQWGNFSNLTYL